MKTNEKGFAHLGLIILAVIVLAAVGFAGYRVINKKEPVANSSNKTTATQSETAQPKEENSQYTALKLASEKVQFEIPKAWIVGKGKCIDSQGAAPTCADGATLTPSEKMPTTYGSSEYFTIYANAYDNKDNQTAQRWFEDVYEGGLSSSSDKVSHEKINGYDTYYFRQINKSYDEIRYVYSANGEAVLVIARVSEKSYAPDGSGQVNASADFTQYIPEIEKMAKTVKIN